MNDLDAYLARIGHTGPLAPDLATLQALTVAHATSIPFENLDPFSGVPVRLDAASLQAKLVDGGRGGYCFEHNRVLQSALDALGFTTSSLQARVVWGRPADAPLTPRTHRMVRIELDGVSYVADVGFGGNTPTGPLRLERDIVQETPHGRYRYRAGADGRWELQVDIVGDWRTTYVFDLAPAAWVDDEPANWFVSTSPTSHFVTGLVAARATPHGGRLALEGRNLSVYRADGTSDRRTLDDVGQLRDVLADELLIRLPEGIDDVLKRLF